MGSTVDPEGGTGDLPGVPLGSSVGPRCADKGTYGLSALGRIRGNLLVWGTVIRASRLQRTGGQEGSLLVLNEKMCVTRLKRFWYALFSRILAGR